VTPAFLGKIVARSEAAERVAALPQPVVFTNGVFDVLHRGHAVYLAQARELGASLVVALIAELKPAVLCKGGDYDMRKLAETALVEGYGGNAVAIPFVEGYSTTELVRRIRRNT
jgi:cytidyltransferase-like protein